MKHILFGLAAVLFASSVALADDQLTAQVKPASAEATQPSAPVPAKVPSGADADVHTANSESALPPKSPLPPGSAASGLSSLGACPKMRRKRSAQNPPTTPTCSSFRSSGWRPIGLAWCSSKRARRLRNLYANMSDPLLARVFDDLRAQDCMPITVQPAMGHADLYQLAAQGKSDDECWTAMRKRLNVFSTATEGACSVLFTTQGFFKALALHRQRSFQRGIHPH